MTEAEWFESADPTQLLEFLKDKVSCRKLRLFARETAKLGALQADLLREIVGNPFRPATIDPGWLTPTVTSLATAAYEDRLMPSGELDPDRLAVLSDALEEAGCDDEDVLGHLRGPGPHVRGCWVVALFLNEMLEVGLPTIDEMPLSEYQRKVLEENKEIDEGSIKRIVRAMRERNYWDLFLKVGGTHRGYQAFADLIYSRTDGQPLTDEDITAIHSRQPSASATTGDLEATDYFFEW